MKGLALVIECWFGSWENAAAHDQSASGGTADYIAVSETNLRAGAAFGSTGF